jgi:hypothetical protein
VDLSAEKQGFSASIGAACLEMGRNWAVMGRNWAVFFFNVAHQKPLENKDKREMGRIGPHF